MCGVREGEDRDREGKEGGKKKGKEMEEENEEKEEGGERDGRGHMEQNPSEPFRALRSC